MDYAISANFVLMAPALDHRVIPVEYDSENKSKDFDPHTESVR